MYWDGSKANVERAEPASRKALELAPDLAEAHASRGFALTLRQQYLEARREFETAIRLNPKLYEAHYLYARACMQEGKLEDAVQHYEDACRVRPEDYQAQLLMQAPLKGLGRKADAAVAQRRGVELGEDDLQLNPDDARAPFLGRGALGQIGERGRGPWGAERSFDIAPEEP